MLQFIKKILGFGPAVDFAEVAKSGAQIIDVRTKGEFQSGHIPGSVNIPLDKLTQNFAKIKKDKPIITCCASGMRSASARSILKSEGYTEVYNGGSWVRLKSKIGK